MTPDHLTDECGATLRGRPSAEGRPYKGDAVPVGGAIDSAPRHAEVELAGAVVVTGQVGRGGGGW